MLFPYTYVPHQMEKMQQFIDFIFFAVWSKAHSRGAYGLHLFAANAKLYEVMKAFHYSDSKGAEFFNTHVETIYKTFEGLPSSTIRKLRRWYKGNNNLERICANDTKVPLVRYTDIQAVHPVLAKQLGVFFKGLYERLDLAALRDKIGDISEHYKIFARTNQLDPCPFCGLISLLGPDHSPREAYDHYLPKALYPFNSINLRNLVPACHYCNSSYKGSKNPAHSPKDPCGQQVRRKLFYPFSPQSWHIELRVELHHGAHENLQFNDIHLEFGPPELAEQIATWKDVYDIDERYRAKLCSPGAKAWATEVLDEWRWHNESDGAAGKAPQAYLRDVARHTERAPYANVNFLKLGYLQACEAAGAFREGPPAKTNRSG